MAYQTQFRRLDVLIEPMRLRAVLLPELLVQVKVWFRGRRGFKDVRGIEAVLGNPRHRIAIIAGVPEGRIGLLERMHPQADIFVGVVFPFIIEHVCGKGRTQDVQGFAENVPQFIHR